MTTNSDSPAAVIAPQLHPTYPFVKVTLAHPRGGVVVPVDEDDPMVPGLLADDYIVERRWEVLGPGQTRELSTERN